MSQQAISRSHSKSPVYTLPPSSLPSKAAVLEWISALLPDLAPSRCCIEQLGDGEAYCRLVNLYAPGSILPARIVSAPRNEYEGALNLKQLQTALSRLRLALPFDIHRVAKRKFNENWALASQLFRAFEPRAPEGKRELPELPHRSSPPKRPSEPAGRLCPSAPRVPPPREQEYPSGSLLFTIDRVKEVLLANTHDTEKVRLIRVLFGLQQEVKVEEEAEADYRLEA